ncbi:MAG: hypothetical protein NZ700_10005 [Gemmataceae bacterium]|nr:hypothetical protein [Gemmataceae bacterium]MDW8267166.1 hypothetical protein [Gemmataceae bacterium]
MARASFLLKGLAGSRLTRPTRSRVAGILRLPRKKILYWFGSFQADHLTTALLGQHEMHSPPFGKVRVDELQGVMTPKHGKGSGQGYEQVAR